jgi:hypothetical protein
LDAISVTDEEKDERELWLDARLEEERSRVLDEVAQAVGRLLAERKDDRDADFLNGQIAALWRTIAELQGSLAKLHAERIRAITGNESVDAKKLN